MGRAVALSVIVIIVLLFSRAVFCFPVLAVHNYFSTERVNTREMFICWCAPALHKNARSHDVRVSEPFLDEVFKNTCHHQPCSAWPTSGAFEISDRCPVLFHSCQKQHFVAHFCIQGG